MIRVCMRHTILHILPYIDADLVNITHIYICNSSKNKKSKSIQFYVRQGDREVGAGGGKYKTKKKTPLALHSHSPALIH